MTLQNFQCLKMLYFDICVSSWDKGLFRQFF
jgi:hypothetical protein